MSKVQYVCIIEEVSERESIGEMSVFKRNLCYKDTCVRKVSVLDRCLR